MGIPHWFYLVYLLLCDQHETGSHNFNMTVNPVIVYSGIDAVITVINAVIFESIRSLKKLIHQVSLGFLIWDNHASILWSEVDDP